MTTFDFQDGNGPLPAHQHPNGGGWVADTATVAKTAYIGSCARVSGNARVSDNACVSGNARVSGNTWVSGSARVSDNACVSGIARVSGSAIIEDSKFPQIKRSDGYDFIAVPCSDGKTRVIAGCRYFTFKEAKKHWEKTRGGTPLGDETMAILKSLKIMLKTYNGIYPNTKEAKDSCRDYIRKNPGANIDLTKG